MDAINSMTSFHYVMSKFANLLIKIKQRMDKLRNETHETIDKLNKEYHLEKHHSKASLQTEANFKSIIDVTVVELERQLNALEISCNNSWIRLFLYISNYVSKAPKIDGGHEEITRNLIPMHNIILPDYFENDFEPTEKYTFNEYSLDDTSEKMVRPSCRRPKELLEEEQFCFNEEV